MTPETHRFADDGAIPNSPLPVLVYHDVEAATDAGTCEALFGANGWGGHWRSQILYEHHFHSTAHEALGIVAGRASVMLGGPGGERFEVRAGDVLVLPAGTGHCRRESSDGLLVVGAYPPGQSWDMRYGDPGEHDEVLANIAAVALPETDPVAGATGPLLEIWR
jgi:uncharacterized protein YjlB